MDVFLYGTENPRNLGSIIRTSVVLGIPRLYIYDKFDLLENQDACEEIKTVCRRNRDSSIDIIPVEDPVEFVFGYENRYATMIAKRCRKIYDMDLPENSLLMFGNEAGGIPRKLSRSKGTQKVTIPTKNSNECLSLPQAYAIFVYEYLRQHVEEFPKRGQK